MTTLNMRERLQAAKRLPVARGPVTEQPEEPRSDVPSIVRRGLVSPAISATFAEIIREEEWTAVDVMRSPEVAAEIAETRTAACRACRFCAELSDGQLWCHGHICRRWQGVFEMMDLRARNRHAGQMCPLPNPAFWHEMTEGPLARYERPANPPRAGIEAGSKMV